MQQDTIGLHPHCRMPEQARGRGVRICLWLGWAQGDLPEVPQPPAAAPKGLEKEIEKLLITRGPPGGLPPAILERRKKRASFDAPAKEAI